LRVHGFRGTLHHQERLGAVGAHGMRAARAQGHADQGDAADEAGHTEQVQGDVLLHGLVSLFVALHAVDVRLEVSVFVALGQRVRHVGQAITVLVRFSVVFAFVGLGFTGIVVHLLLLSIGQPVTVRVVVVDLEGVTLRVVGAAHHVVDEGAALLPRDLVDHVHVRPMANLHLKLILLLADVRGIRTPGVLLLSEDPVVRIEVVGVVPLALHVHGVGRRAGAHALARGLVVAARHGCCDEQQGDQ